MEIFRAIAHMAAMFITSVAAFCVSAFLVAALVEFFKRAITWRSNGV